jgi:tetratricopeptide (TPR) repeat protein
MNFFQMTARSNDLVFRRRFWLSRRQSSQAMQGNTIVGNGRDSYWPFLAASIWLSTVGSLAEAQQPLPPQGQVKNPVIEFVQNQVEVLRAGSKTWDEASTNKNHSTLLPGDQLRTGENSRAGLRLPNHRATLILDGNSHFLVPSERKEKSAFELLKGRLFNFHRGPSDEQRFKTPSVSAVVRGTDFALKVEPDGTTTVSMLAGAVRLENSFGELELASGSQAIVKPGEAPRRTAVVTTLEVIQWCLYYPAVLDAKELPLGDGEAAALKSSLRAYGEGDLLHALAALPREWRSGSASEQLYGAAVLLSVGNIDAARPVVTSLERATNGTPEAKRLARLAAALDRMIATVKLEKPFPLDVSSDRDLFATEYLAESYRLQAEGRLEQALAMARRAMEKDAAFSFAWAHVAGLEFSFGRVNPAKAALARSLELGPRNAEAVALRGFVLSAENRISEALKEFDRAIELDGALANGWLGRGLCRFRRGETALGLDDLQMAATVEPQRAVLRSYLGKGFAEAEDDQRATGELKLARELDLNDPTAWFYAALLKQRQNRINEAISDLEASQERNDNRSLFRSRLLLDEDRAVRSANLASIYRDAGMTDVSVREAARAVTYDYANDSAHLFLSDSFNELRDPTRFNLRYETVWFNELLLANILAPVGGGRLSQHVSQQEYSRLFEADGVHLANSTLARSDNKSVKELASQFGTFGNTSYSLDLDYDYQRGVRPNNDLSSIEWYSTIKQQITPQDTALALIKYEDYHSGDNFQYYDPSSQARPRFRFEEYQHPIAVGAWHHEWSPGIHTLLLGGRLENEQHFSDRAAHQLLLFEDSSGNIFPDSEPFDVEYRSSLEIYTAELNQLFQWNRVSISAGARYQWGTFDTTVTLTNPPGLVPFLFPNVSDTTKTNANFERFTGYGYLTLEPLDRLWLIGGLAYDDISYPRNFRHPPIAGGEDYRSQIGPKAGFVWSPLRQAALRGVFTRSLSGVSLDESYRLEPTQLAGFPQAFRSLISESLVGSVAAPKYETYGLALDLKFPSRTYAGVQVERLESDVSGQIGVFSISNSMAPYSPDLRLEKLGYRENSISASLNQLVGENFVFGASYKFARVKLHDQLPQVPVSALSTADLTERSHLHQTSGYVLFNHPSGFFARAETHWYHQSNSGDPHAGPGDDFFQHNLFAGYRFAHQRAELLLGVLNLTDEDYHLSPLTTYAELPRERTFMVRLKFEF